MKNIRLKSFLVWCALFAFVSSASLQAATAASATPSEQSLVELVSSGEERFVFNLPLNGLPDNVVKYSYRVLDDTATPFLYVWSGVRALPDGGSLEVQIEKRSLLQSDSHGYRLELQLLDAGDQTVDIFASDAFRYESNEAAPEPVAGLTSFPGAVGFGTTAVGGRGGKVYKVTTLEDYDKGEKPIEGSLRYAVEQRGPRTVVFGVSGNIKLKRELTISASYITIAGNTAPFPGISVTGYTVRVRTDNVILRHLRVRLDVDIMRQRFAQGKDSGWDTINASKGEYIIFDHLSGSHSVDETISFTEVDLSTMSNSIVAFSLRGIFHDYYLSRGPVRNAVRHNFGGLIAFLGRKDRHASVSSHTNVWAHHTRRMPGLSAADDPDNLPAYIDIRNSVMYNWKDNAAGSEAPERQPMRQNYYLNFVDNYLKPGPETLKESWYDVVTVRGPLNKLYLSGNVHESDGAATSQSRLVAYRYNREGTDHFLAEPFPAPSIPKQGAPTLESIASDFVGASLPARDSVDYLAIKDVHEGTGSHPFADMQVDESPPLPVFPVVSHVYHDGEDVFPVWWKLLQGLGAQDRIHPLADSAADGYTNIEKYMYGLSLMADSADHPQLESDGDPLDLWVDGTVAKGAKLSPTGHSHWAEASRYADSSGTVIIASGVDEAEAGPASLGALLSDERNYWSSGEGDGSPWVAFGFPFYTQFSEVRISKTHPALFTPDHDPRHIVVQGLLGWPDHWVDIAEVTDLPVLRSQHNEHVIAFDPKLVRPYAAYRIVVKATQAGDTANGANPAKIERVRFR